MNVAASTTWVFRPDGTFDNGNAAIVGDAGKASANHGTYEFTGHQMTLKFADGTNKTVDTFGTDEKPKPYILGIDGNTYHGVKYTFICQGTAAKPQTCFPGVLGGTSRRLRK